MSQLLNTHAIAFYIDKATCAANRDHQALTKEVYDRIKYLATKTNYDPAIAVVAGEVRVGAVNSILSSSGRPRMDVQLSESDYSQLMLCADADSFLPILVNIEAAFMVKEAARPRNAAEILASNAALSSAKP